MTLTRFFRQSVRGALLSVNLSGSLAIIAGLACVCTHGPAACAAQAGPLDERVKDLVAKNKMGQAEVGVCIVDAETGQFVASLNERKKLIPASNLKLLTSATALAVFGPDHQFKTSIFLDGTRVIVVGSGDPAFADPELLQRSNVSLDQFMDSIVKPLVDAKITGITEVVIDDRVFDREAVHPTWPKNQLSRWYCAEVSGLNFNTNVLEVWPKPANSNEPAIYTKSPNAPWIEINNRTRTVGVKTAGATTAIGLDRSSDDNHFNLSGTILVAPSEAITATLHEPALVFGRFLADRLVASGVAPSMAPDQPASVKVRLAETSEKFAFEAPPIVVVQTPITAVLKRCNVNSQNLFAESLLKAVGNKVTGQAGSWANGAAVVRMQLIDRVGLDAGELRMVDGSGMSAENSVTPAMLALWMAAISRDKGIGQAFIDSLPAPGEGSLEKRFHKRPVLPIKGKSGFITGVQCLSGFVMNPNTGRRLSYSVMVNRIELAQGSAKELHEDIVRAAAEWLSKQPARAQPQDKAR